MGKLIMKNFYGMAYLTVALRTEMRGEHEVVVGDEDLERRVATLLIEAGVPLRGIEVRYIRKALGWSYAAMSERLRGDMTVPGLMKWEKEKAAERLGPMNEVAVRALFAEHLGIRPVGTFSEMVGKEKADEVSLDLAKTG